MAPNALQEVISLRSIEPQRRERTFGIDEALDFESSQSLLVTAKTGVRQTEIAEVKLGQDRWKLPWFMTRKPTADLASEVLQANVHGPGLAPKVVPPVREDLGTLALWLETMTNPFNEGTPPRCRASQSMPFATKHPNATILAVRLEFDTRDRAFRWCKHLPCPHLGL